MRMSWLYLELRSDLQGAQFQVQPTHAHRRGTWCCWSVCRLQLAPTSVDGPVSKTKLGSDILKACLFPTVASVVSSQGQRPCKAAYFHESISAGLAGKKCMIKKLKKK